MTVESAPDISVVVPVHDESGAAVPLAREIAEAFAGRSFEMIFVDDASRDATLAELQAVMPELPMLRVLAHGSNAGQSRAVRTGVLAARGAIIVTLDGDGQNPPIDAPRLVDALIAAPADVALIGGRRAKRQDSAAKRQASLWANRIRKRLRDVFLRLPYFDHIHRYLPALVIREGYRNQYLDVGHRHRETGRSKYTNWGRLRASLSDLMGVIWLKSRSRRPGAVSEF